MFLPSKIHRPFLAEDVQPTRKNRDMKKVFLTILSFDKHIPLHDWFSGKDLAMPLGTSQNVKGK